MKKLLPILLLLLLAFYAGAQNTFTAVVTADDDSHEPLVGALAYVVDTTLNGMADTTGAVTIQNIPDGEFTIEVSYTGYFKKRIKVKFPQAAGTKPVEVKLQSQAEEIEEVVVTTTRNYQTAEYQPTRVEVVTDEDVEERSHDKPSDVSHIIREQPGVQVQRTSATAGTMNIRLQGLRGKYVQILKDGFPLFSGFSNVIGITQIPPLDLKQVEIIKGPSSTLYGGDAIAGVINMVSKTPGEQPVYDIMFNGETANAYDVGAYAAQKIKWFAFSLTGMYRYQFAKDWDGDHFTETPKLQRYHIAPQLFFDIAKHAKLNIGGNYTHENRLGGALEYIKGVVDTTYNYYERNLTDHVSSNFKFEYDFEKNGKLTVKNATNYFNRDLKIPYYYFRGKQVASASEINYHLIHKRHDVVIGFDVRTDKFDEGVDSSALNRSYSFLTFGGFIQYIYNFDDKTTVEGGLRVDYNTRYKVYPLPHFAIRRKWNNVFSTRLNVGMGYKLPTIFQDESEEARYLNVLPIADSIRPELSLGGTIDWKVKLPGFNGVFITLHQVYFLNHIFKPLLPETITDTACHRLDCDKINYANARGYMRTGGVETGINVAYRGFGITVGYSYTDNNRRINGVRSIAPLTSKHIVSLLAGYEVKHFSVGVDVYYYSPVKLSDGRIGKSIWEVGLNIQYSFKYMLLFANFENIADIRQTSYGPTVFPNPNYTHPRFSEIYAPLEGRLFNVGFKLHLAAFAKGNKSEGGIEKVRGKSDD